MIIILIIYFTILTATILLIIRFFKSVQCGGRIDPTLRYCDNQSNLVTGKKIPENECNPSNMKDYNESIVIFLRYMRNIIQTSQTNLYDRMILDGYNSITQGIMYFAIPPLLKLLDSDFGQNQIAPYGIVSFPNTYIDNCISDSDTICDRLEYPNLCKLFFKERELVATRDRGCPFDVSDQTKDTSIEDIGFFNMVGILGAFSLNALQMVVLYYNLPVEDLDLNYWSFNVYLADRIKKGLPCAPMRQTYLASVVPPMNCFMTPAISGKRFNPLTGKGDVIEQGHIRMYLVIGLDSKRLETMKQYLEKRNDSDFVHVFQIPTHMNIDPTIPNPNHLLATDPMYDPKTDRLSIFLRLSPSPNKDAQNNIQRYVQREYAFAEVLLIEDATQDVNIPAVLYKEPLYIAPIYNEKKNLLQSFQKIVNVVTKTTHPQKLQTRSTILNIFAPLYPGLLATTTRKYKGGYQAIQLAGIGQGDNSDTQYRLSQGICLAPDDVMVSISVNHAKYGNCVYNNINIIDLNKAYSLDSVTLDQQIPYDVYIVLTGRNQNKIDDVHQKIGGLFTETGLTVIIYDILIPEEPLCHQILMAERVYVNRRYTDVDKNKMYLLDDLFGKNMKELQNINDDVAWQNLINVTAPDVDTLIPPVYLKIGKTKHNKKWLIISFSILFVCLAIISYCLWSWKSR